MARRGVYSLKVMPLKDHPLSEKDLTVKELRMSVYSDENYFNAKYIVTDPRDVPYYMKHISDYFEEREL